jgi:hypothetical protein
MSNVYLETNVKAFDSKIKSADTQISRGNLVICSCYDVFIFRICVDPIAQLFPVDM